MANNSSHSAQTPTPTPTERNAVKPLSVVLSNLLFKRSADIDRLISKLCELAESNKFVKVQFIIQYGYHSTQIAGDSNLQAAGNTTTTTTTTKP